MNVPSPGTFAVYVHFPYCEVRCTYCDFNTYVVQSLPARAYTEAVLRELASRQDDYANWTLTSLYFGGGTPSLWGPEGVGAVIDGVMSAFPRQTEHVEITMECNPGEARLEHLSEYRAAGVERLSMGVQSLSDELLQGLARRHSAAEALAGLRAARGAGFRSVSADAMFGLPGQSIDRFESDLRTLADLGIDHLSVYHLTLEPGTAMTREVRAGRLRLPDEDTQADMWETIAPTLAPYGLSFYEVSNLARPGHESRHNSAYWLGRPYLGLGAGAHSLLPPLDWRAPDAVARRRSNRKHHSTYTRMALAGDDLVDSMETLTAEDHARERLFTGLRHLPGIDIDALSMEVGVDVRGAHQSTFERFVHQGLLQWRGPVLALTSRGLTFADTVAAAFF